ncbi:MAG: hypothetical protein ACK5LJ_17750 [Paracoccus sp. (in: a-proteobacteria)]
MDLNKYVQNIIKNIDINKMFKEQIEKKIEETVKETINSNLKSYSDFGEQLNKYFRENLKVNLESLPMTEYSNFVTEQVADIVKQEMSQERAEKIKSKLREKLGLYNVSEISLKDLFGKISDTLYEACEDEWNENNGCFCGEAPVYTLCCRLRSEVSYRDESFEIIIVKGNDVPVSPYDPEIIANLFLNCDGKAYHTSERANGEEVSRLFNYYAYNKTLITDLKEIEETVEYDPF